MTLRCVIQFLLLLGCAVGILGYHVPVANMASDQDVVFLTLQMVPRINRYPEGIFIVAGGNFVNEQSNAIPFTNIIAEFLGSGNVIHWLGEGALDTRLSVRVIQHNGPMSLLARSFVRQPENGPITLLYLAHDRAWTPEYLHGLLCRLQKGSLILVDGVEKHLPVMDKVTQIIGMAAHGIGRSPSMAVFLVDAAPALTCPEPVAGY